MIIVLRIRRIGKPCNKRKKIIDCYILLRNVTLLHLRSEFNCKLIAHNVTCFITRFGTVKNNYAHFQSKGPRHPFCVFKIQSTNYRGLENDILRITSEVLINNSLNIHMSQLLNTITSRLAITITNERLQRFLMQYPALFRLQAGIVFFLPLRPLSPVHYGSEISVIHGFIQEIYPTYGVILSQNERVFFDCHSLSIGHGEAVFDIRDKAVIGVMIQAAVIRNIQGMQ